MKIKGIETRSIWPTNDGFVEVIDQTKLPHGFGTVRLTSMASAARAISTMIVRGAPLIGATGAYGLALACATIRPMKVSTRRMRRCWRRGRPPSICAGRCSACATRCATGREASAPMPPGTKPPRSATRTWRCAGASASTAWAFCAASPKRRPGRSTSSPIAMPAGSRASIRAPRSRRSIWRMTTASSCMSGWMKRGRAIRALR